MAHHSIRVDSTFFGQFRPFTHIGIPQIMDITIHAKNGRDTITAPVEHIVEQLVILGGLDPLKRLIAALDALTATKKDGTTEARELAERQYLDAMAQCRSIIRLTPATPAPSPSNRTICKGCGKAISYLTTLQNTIIPCDAETVGDGDKIFNSEVHRSHFATCKKADDFRKKTPKTKVETASNQPQSALLF
jgi:hypothetical protein